MDIIAGVEVVVPGQSGVPDSGLLQNGVGLIHHLPLFLGVVLGHIAEMQHVLDIAIVGVIHDPLGLMVIDIVTGFLGVVLRIW